MNDRTDCLLFPVIVLSNLVYSVDLICKCVVTISQPIKVIGTIY